MQRYVATTSLAYRFATRHGGNPAKIDLGISRIEHQVDVAVHRIVATASECMSCFISAPAGHQNGSYLDD